MPYYVLFEIPTLAKGSSICSEGEVFYYFSKDEINIHNIKNINFSKFKNDCMFLDNNNNFFYILGYSINKLDNLKIYLDKNLLLKIISISKIFLNLILIFLIIHTCFGIKYNKTCLIYLISFLATIIIAMLKDTNLITGLRFFRGGADGLNYYSLGRDILSNFEKGNFLLALRGGSDIFYFMPGQRYFLAISNFIFGATSYGYLLITSTLPTIFYIFFKKYLNEKTAVLLFVLFVFFPIFENLGFGYYNYIHQVFRNHAETLSILLILLSFIGQSLKSVLTCLADIFTHCFNCSEYHSKRAVFAHCMITKSGLPYFSIYSMVSQTIRSFVLNILEILVAERRDE